MLKVGGENVVGRRGGELPAPPSRDRHRAGRLRARRLYVEVPAAFIQLKPGVTVTEQEIIDFCAGSIATFRVPRYVRFVTGWPMSGTKIKKADLPKTTPPT